MIGEEINKKLGDVAAQIIQKIYEQLTQKAGVAFDIAKVTFLNGFEDYINSNIAAHSYVKTIINRVSPVHIQQSYVEVIFELEGLPVAEKDFRDTLTGGQVIATTRQFVITGNAGSGKSMTMKHTCLSLLQGESAIPVLIELRNVSVADAPGFLLKQVCERIGLFTSGFTEPALIFALRKGLICLLFDGFDEVAPEHRDAMQSEIINLVDMAPEAKIVVSGRPDSRYEIWPTFKVLKIKPMQKYQVLQVIEKAEYDEEVKIIFSERVDEELYESHSQLLSNPLLCCMMLLTYNEFAEIPSKMHIFYKTAFEVLIRKHDALKPKFRRQFLTNLESDDYTQAFETFCYLSYSDSSFGFVSVDAALAYAEESIKYEGIDCKSNDFINDAVQNVCVILSEGERLSFLHRSFQEYFAASFLSYRGVGNYTELVANIIGIGFSDKVMDFMIDMNLELLLRDYVPNMSRRMLGILQGDMSPGEKVAKFFDGVHVYRDGSVSFFWSMSGERLARQYWAIQRIVPGIRRDNPTLSTDVVSHLFETRDIQSGNDEDGEFVILESGGDIFDDAMSAAGVVDSFIERLSFASAYAGQAEQRRLEALTPRIRLRPKPV